MKFSTLGFLLILSAAVPVVGSAETPDHPSSVGRYAITSSTEGLYFLDTATGALWLKPRKGGANWQRVDSPVIHLADESTGGEIPEGFRLVTVNVANLAAHMDAIRPGDVLDVYLTYESRDSQGTVQTKTKQILSKIKLFAIGKDQINPNDKSRNFWLMVEPEQAALLMFADHKGDINVALHKERTATDP